MISSAAVEAEDSALLALVANLQRRERGLFEEAEAMARRMGGVGRTEEEVCRLIGADSLQYLPLDSLKAMSQNLHLGFCDACFTGDYVLPVPGESGRQLTINND